MVSDKPPAVDGVRVPYEKSVSELQTLFREEKYQRWVAIVGIACSSVPASLDALSEIVSDSDAYERRFALQWLGRRADARERTELIVKGLSDKDQRVVRTALQVARELNLTEAHDATLHLVEAQDESTRQSALWALEVLGDAEDFDLLVERFHKDSSEKVRRTAGWTLFERRNAKTAARLVELWRSDALGRHRKWACLVAEEFPQNSFTDAIVHLSGDSDSHVRKAAERSLAAISALES